MPILAFHFCMYKIFFQSGTVKKLLQRVHKETEIRVDVIDVAFPIESQQAVRHAILNFAFCV